MKPVLAQILACPICRGGLTLITTETVGSEIRSGSFTCSPCQRRFPIEDGVPHFLLGSESAATRRGYDTQWRLRMKGKFEKKSRLYYQDYEELTRWWFANCLGDVSRGEWLLDLGCGMAEKAAVMAREHPELHVVAMDIGDTVVVAAEQPDNPPNLHFLQGDMMCPPLKTGFFSKVVSFGVLHHAPDARDSFRIASRLVAPAGRLLIWLYPHPDDDWLFARYYRIRSRVFLGKAHRIHPLFLLWLVRVYCFFMVPVFLYEFNRKIRPRYRDCTYVRFDGLGPLQRYKSLVFLVYDVLVAEHLSLFRRSEVLDWFKEAGFDMAATDDEGHFWGERRDQAAP